MVIIRKTTLSEGKAIVMLVPYQGRAIQRGGMPVFDGAATFQRGRGFGSVLSKIFRNVVLPVAKNVGKK